MYVLGYFIKGVASVLDIGLNVYLWIVVIRALLSWVNPDPYNPIVRTLQMATDPVLKQARRLIPFDTGGFDLSPIIVIAAIVFLRQFVVGVLFRVGMDLIR